MVTLKDVAQAVGVSPITVSRAFNNSLPVASATKERILTVARELGYVPDLHARALVNKTSPIIGVVVLELDNPFYAPIINAIQEVAKAKGYMLLVSQSERQQEIERNILLNQFQQLRIAGILVSPVGSDSAGLQQLHANAIPVVALARHWEDGDYVSVDDHAGGRMVGDHLAQLGHRGVAVVTLNEPENTAIRDRLEGFADALHAHGLMVAATIATDMQRIEDGIMAADRFLDLPARPTAAFVTADRLAIGFIHGLLARGLRVPDDVAVVGYDDINYAAYLEVPLTTVALPKYEIGKQAAEILFDRIEAVDRAAHPERKHVLLQPQLVIRKSCGST